MTNLIPTTCIEEIDAEPRIKDILLAERLGFDRPRVIRELILRNSPELRQYGTIAVRHGAYRGKTFIEYHLNEGQALVICALSRTERAAEARKLLIDVFMAWRQGKTVDVKQHYRRPPGTADINFELTSVDSKTAMVEIIMPMRKALDLMKMLFTLA